MTRVRVPCVVLPGGWPPFRAAAVLGVLLGLTLATALAPGRVPSPGAWALTVAAAAASAYAYGVGVKVLTGGEWTASFQVQASVMAGTWAALTLAGVPVLPCLDLLAVALCVSHGVGRVGCALAGCCHGRPARHGLVYGEEHVAGGFPRAFVGLALWPAQPVEAAALGALTLALVGLTLAPHLPGDVLAAFACGYAAVRLLIDGQRADSPRPYLLGLARAQVATGLFVLLVARLSVLGLLPPRPAWRLAPYAWVALAGGLLLLRRRRPAAALLSPAHLSEVRAALNELATGDGRDAAPRIVRTSAGLRLSASFGAGRNAGPAHVTFSQSGHVVRPAEARALAGVVGQCLGLPIEGLVAGAPGVFHMVFRPSVGTAGGEGTSA